MKKENKYRDIELILSQETNIGTSLLFNDLAFLLALAVELTGKDGTKPEDLITDEASERVSLSQSALFPLLNHADDSTLEEALYGAEIIPQELIQDILEVKGCRKNSIYHLEDIYDFNNPDLDAFSSAEATFLREEISLYRIRNWIKEIATGIEEYGKMSYSVPEEYDHLDILEGKEGILKPVEELDRDEAKKELSGYLMLREDDEEEEYHDKKQVLGLLGIMQKYLG